LRVYWSPTFYFRYAAIASSKLKNRFVLSVKPLRTCGYALYVGMLAAEGETDSFLDQSLFYDISFFLICI